MSEAVPKRTRSSDVATCRIDPGDESQEAGAASDARFQLLVWSGDRARLWSLPDGQTLVVGRTADADIHLDGVVISRRHARLWADSAGVHLADLGSQNGTRVNGERVTETRLLFPGDLVSFGDVTGVVVTRRAPEKPGPTPEQNAEHVISIGKLTIIVADGAMRRVYDQVARLARTDLSVLILGETGTGKEIAAAALHEWSTRHAQPMVSINCAALPEGLAESELFGHERGAFTGAVAPKQGLLEAANGGAVLFDEIGDLPLGAQAKLLRVIETRRLMRVGSVREQSIDVRIIAATHRDLDEGVKNGWFRADLYYRLSTAIIRLPPLRLRPREIPLLARKFLDEACRPPGRAAMTLDDHAVALLLAYDWPGNVRELKNMMDYLVATSAASVVTAELIHDRLDHPLWRLSPTPQLADADTVSRLERSDETGPMQPLAQANRDFERRTIEGALTETGGNKTQAAKKLGVPLRTFMDKVKRYGL